MTSNQGAVQRHRSRTFWIVAVIISSTVIASGLGVKGLLSRRAMALKPQERLRLSVKDGRPVASAIASLETRFGRVITYEDPPLIHPDDVADVTEFFRIWMEVIDYDKLIGDALKRNRILFERLDL